MIKIEYYVGRYEKNHYPDYGWLFPCVVCNQITGRIEKINQSSRILVVYLCNNCINCKTINLKRARRLNLLNNR